MEVFISEMLDFGFYNMDCMDGMKEFPDKYFDLAIVDPPYGDAGGGGRTEQDSENASTGTSIHRLGNAGKWASSSWLPGGQWMFKNGRYMGNEIRKKIIAWDIAPGKEYFNELFRISRNQIIWGGTTLNFQHQGVSLYGAKQMYLKNFQWQWQNMLGCRFNKMQRSLTIRQ